MRTIDLDGPPDPPAPPGNALEACDRALIDILTALPRNPDTWARRHRNLRRPARPARPDRRHLHPRTRTRVGAADPDETSHP